MRVSRTGVLRATSGLLWLLLSVSARAETLVLSPSRDNTIFEDNIAYSGGISSFTFTGSIASGSPRRTLWQFDVSAIPVGARINSVTLRFVVNRAGPGSSLTDLGQLHRLTASWGEGASDGGTGGGGTQATPEDATWAYRFYGNPGAGVPRVPWSTAGGDYAATPSATLNMGGVGTYTFPSSAALAADVSIWINDPASNHGWILIGPEDPDQSQNAKRIISRESPSLNERPRLTIDYTPQAPAPAVTVPALPELAWWLLAGLIAAQGFRFSSRQR